MADDTPGFNSLDPLGPEFGKINQPIIDQKGLSPFEGDRMQDKPINFPAMPGLNLSVPTRNVRQVAVGAPGNPANANKKATAQDIINAQGSYIKAVGQASQSKDTYAKIYSYNAGPDGNAFYKRYQAYGQEKFDEIGFSPLRDNESNFNERTTRWDDFSRMMTHSFLPLLGSGFTSGPKSLFRMLKGDFSGADLEDARLYEEAAAIGQSSKGGVFGFVNNTVMNFAYTAGIISEVILEEIGASLLAAPTGGVSLAAITAKNMSRIKGIGTAMKSFKAIRTSLSELKSLQAVRNFKNSLNANVIGTKLGRFLNPLENTFEALQLAKADNLTGLAKGFTTAGGLYRDIRTINMAVSESRLEAGMVENSVYDDLYNEHYNLTGEAPDNKTQEDIQKKSKEASANTFYWNTGLIYATNKITFNNITGPRGGIRKFMKSVQDDFVSVGGGKFGNIGKIVYNNVSKKWAYEATNLKNLAKSWWKNPGFKTAKGTIGYFKANISEGLQENMQEIISRTNEGYYKDSFNSKARRAQEYAKGAALYGGKSQGEFFRKEVGAELSMQGLETFGSGFFMGMLAAPLNNSIPFLSKQWNRIYDKQAYNDYVQKKERMTTGIVEVLNDIDMGEFLKSKMFNLSTQDFVNEIRSKASKKEGMDAELEGLVDSVEQMILSTNVSDVFTDHLSSYMDMTDPEFMEAMGGIQKEEIPEYKKRLTDSVDKIKSIKKKYDYYTEKKPNPVTDAYISSLDKDSDEYEEAISLKYGWDLAVKNAVFFHTSYEDTMQRMSDIQEKFLSQTTLKNMGQREMNLLFQPHKLKNEIELLKNDITVGEQTDSTLPGAKEDLAKKKRILAQMELFSEKFKSFDLFYNRTDYYESHKEEVKKALGVDLTEEELEKVFNDQLGKLDGVEDQAKVLGELKESLTDYLRAVAEINEDTVFDENVDKAFELLADHYKLYRESSHMVRFINTLHDPSNFNDLARRNQAWMKDLYKRRADYYDKIVRGEMEDVEFNALLNKLADFGMAITPEDFLEWKNNRTMPKEFIDIANKQIIPENSEKYYNAVDLFEKATDLRDNTTTVAPDIMDDEYNKKLAALDTAMQAEINALEQVEQRSSIGTISPNATSKTFTINKVKKETAIGDQVELTDVKGNKTVVRKDENEQIVDEAGEPITGNKKYVSGDKFRMIMVADPAAVKAIEDRYTERKNKLKEEYLNRAATSEKPVVVDEMTTSDIMTKYPELYQQLLTAYEAMMIEDLGMEDYTAMSDVQKDNGLAKYIKSAKGRLIVDEYMEKQKITKSAQTEANEMTFTLDGTAYDTATITSVPKLRSLIKNFNKKISDIKKKSMQDAKDQEAVLDFQTMINNLNLIIEKRLQGGTTDELKAAIAKIKIMQKNQDGIVKQDIRSITIPKADRAWKKGDTRYTKQGIRVEFRGDNLYNIAGEDRVFNADTPNASSFQRSIDMAIYSVNPMETPNVYMIKGDQHERVSYAIKRVYDVFGLKPETLVLLNNAFDVTIGVKGFNEASVTAFIEELKAQKASDSDGVMSGFSTFTFDEIRDELLGYYDSMTIMGGAPTTAPTPEVDPRIADVKKRMQYSIKEVNDNTFNGEGTYFGPNWDPNDMASIVENTQSVYGDTKQEVIDKLNQLYAKESAALGTTTAGVFTPSTPYGTAKGAPLTTGSTITITPGSVDIEEVRKLALNTAAEQTYEASKGVGNYADAQSKRIFDGEEAVFDEEKITKEAFDALFDPKTGYLTGLKQRADKGEFFIATDIIVYGTVVDADGNTRKIAGEIDLLVADRDGKIHIIDLKTGTYGKWQGYNIKGTIGYNKRIENTLQQMSYSNLVFNQYGVETNIGILPIQAKYDVDASEGKLEEASRPTPKKLFEDDDMSLLESNKPFSVKLYKDQPLQQLDAEGNVVDTTVEELISKIIPRKDGKGAAGPTGPVVPDANSTDDETQGGTGTSKGKRTSKRTAEQKESFEIFRDRLMEDLTEAELGQINTEIFAAKMGGDLTQEDYDELTELASRAESDIFMGEIPVLSVKNVKLNSKLTAKMDFTTTVDKTTTIYEAGEKVVVTEVTKDSIKVKILKDGKIVTIPDEKINDIFVETSKYDDNANDMPANMSTTYKPTTEEKIVIKETTDNITDFLSDTDGSKTAAVSKGKGMKPKDALDDLNDNVNCP